MPKSRRSREALLLEKWRVSLENSSTQQEIKESLSNYGYTPEKMEEGKVKYLAAVEAYDKNVKEGNEASAAYDLFEETFDNLDEIYSKQRKLAKVAFKDNEAAKRDLFIHEPKNRTYIKAMSGYKKFYNGLNDNEEYKTAIAGFRVTDEDIQNGLTAIETLERTRAEYIRELGESRFAVSIKDAAMEDAERWMNDFYKVARVALDDKPKLLEALF